MLEQIARAFSDRDGYVFVIERLRSAREISSLAEIRTEAEWLTARGAQFRVVAVDHEEKQIRLIEVPMEERKAVSESMQFSEPEWAKTTPDEDARWESFKKRHAKYRADVASGKIKPVELTRAQKIIAEHMQYG